MLPGNDFEATGYSGAAGRGYGLHSVFPSRSVLEPLHDRPQLRPHKRQRRLPMGSVRKSVERHAAMKAEQCREIEYAYSRQQSEAARQRHSDEALIALADLVAAFLSADFTPHHSESPAIRISGRANDIQPTKAISNADAGHD